MKVKLQLQAVDDDPLLFYMLQKPLKYINILYVHSTPALNICIVLYI